MLENLPKTPPTEEAATFGSSVLLLRPGVDGAAVKARLLALSLTLSRAQPRAARQFCEQSFVDEAEKGVEVIYREDHVLGQRLLFVDAPDAGSAQLLRQKLGAVLPAFTLAEVLAAAEEAAEAAEGTLTGAAGLVAALGPLTAVLAYAQPHEQADDDAAVALAEKSARAYGLLGRCLRHREQAVRRAILRCAAYLLSPAMTELLRVAAQDPDLLPEAQRQLALRAAPPLADADNTTDYVAYWQLAEMQRALAQPLFALVSARTALALARRMGIRLYEILTLTQELTADLDPQLADAAAGRNALAPLQALLAQERFHVVEEVATALLELEPPLPPPLPATILRLLAEALEGRGRPDLAAEALAKAQTLST